MAEEVDEIKRAFQKYDKDKNGVISVDEAHSVLREELGFSEASTKRLIKVYDRNTDGKLSYEEFIWFYWKIQRMKKHLEDLFQRFDDDSNGAISADEVRGVLAEQGFCDEDIRQLVDFHDVNKDGVLQYNEFVKFWHNITHS